MSYTSFTNICDRCGEEFIVGDFHGIIPRLCTGCRYEDYGSCFRSSCNGRQLIMTQADLRRLEAKKNAKPSITKVIFNKPATIVFWSDGTKTVVKAQKGDKFNKEKGLAMAITKKALGNEGNYYDEIKKWIE